MKTLTCVGILSGVRLSTLSIEAAFTVDGPKTQKTLMAYYDKTAGVARADQTELARGQRMFDDSMKSPQGGNIRTPLKECWTC